MNTAGGGRCPECGARDRDGMTCREHFNQMLAWEFADPSGAGAAHNLTVLSYYLQHPSLYSPEGLQQGMRLLRRFIVDGAPAELVRRQLAGEADSGRRHYRIGGRPGRRADYPHPVAWTLTAPDVTGGGLEGYCDRVRAWARAVFADLAASGNLPTETG